MKRKKRPNGRLLLAMMIAAAFLVYDGKLVSAMDLNQFQWQHRLLFLFAPDASHPNFAKLHDAIGKQMAEIKERDLIVFEILEQGASWMGAAPLDRRKAISIREQLAVPPQDYTLVLVGKDGGVKLKRAEYVSLAAVFELIDSMPMRQNEMRQRKK